MFLWNMIDADKDHLDASVVLPVPHGLFEECLVHLVLIIWCKKTFFHWLLKLESKSLSIRIIIITRHHHRLTPLKLESIS